MLLVLVRCWVHFRMQVAIIYPFVIYIRIYLTNGTIMFKYKLAHHLCLHVFINWWRWAWPGISIRKHCFLGKQILVIWLIGRSSVWKHISCESDQIIHKPLLSSHNGYIAWIWGKDFCAPTSSLLFHILHWSTRA